jgi:hypothetical protein
MSLPIQRLQCLEGVSHIIYKMDFLPSLCNKTMIKDCMLFISADTHTNICNTMINGVAAVFPHMSEKLCCFLSDILVLFQLVLVSVFTRLCDISRVFPKFLACFLCLKFCRFNAISLRSQQFPPSGLVALCHSV